MDIHQSGDRALCELQGRLLYENLPGVQQELESLIENGTRQLFVKIDQLLFLDSSALGMLLSLNTRAELKRARLSIVSPPSHIRAMFESTKLDEVLEILNEEEALSVTSELIN